MTLAAEEWRSVIGWEGLYEVSDLGRVRSASRKVRAGTGSRVAVARVLAQTNCRGYRRVKLCRPARQVVAQVHVLVMAAFVGPTPAGCEIRHRDGDAADNRLSMLEFGTPKENAADRDAHGTTSRGVRQPGSKLTDADIPRIFDRAAAGVTQRLIAEEFGVTQGVVWRVLARRTWSHVSIGSRP